MSDGISPNKLNDLTKVYLEKIAAVKSQEVEKDIARWSEPPNKPIDVTTESKDPTARKPKAPQFNAVKELVQKSPYMKPALQQRNEEFEDLREVIDKPETEKEAEKKVTEKKVTNKVEINPKLKEAISKLGGELISVKENVGSTVVDHGETPADHGPTDNQVKAKEKRSGMLKRQILIKKMQALRSGGDTSSITASYHSDAEVVEGVKDLVKKGVKRHKDAVEKKKIKNRKAVPYAALAAEHEPDGEMIEEVGVSSSAKMKEAQKEAELKKKEADAVKKVKKEEYTVTAADKKGNTPAWQGYKAKKKNVKTGKPLYKKADHVEESRLDKDPPSQFEKGDDDRGNPDYMKSVSHADETKWERLQRMRKASKKASVRAKATEEVEVGEAYKAVTNAPDSLAKMNKRYKPVKKIKNPTDRPFRDRLKDPDYKVDVDEEKKALPKLKMYRQAGNLARKGDPESMKKQTKIVSVLNKETEKGYKKAALDKLRDGGSPKHQTQEDYKKLPVAKMASQISKKQFKAGQSGDVKTISKKSTETGKMIGVLDTHDPQRSKAKSKIKEDKAFDTVVANLRKQHGKDSVITKDNPPKPPTEAQKKAYAAHKAKIAAQDTRDDLEKSSQGRYSRKYSNVGSD